MKNASTPFLATYYSQLHIVINYKHDIFLLHYIGYETKHNPCHMHEIYYTPDIDFELHF
jgi:hypothetical protein